MQISIHAPPRGATPGERVGQQGVYISIHAPPRGATRAQRSGTGSRSSFQFTPLREGRRHDARDHARLIHISIHAPPRGATPMICIYSADCTISIHAPPRGATTTSCTSRRRKFYFNSRPSARGDRRSRKTACSGNYFNSRPSARGDESVLRTQPRPSAFQFTPLREGRLACFHVMTCRSISIHAPPRGATILMALLMAALLLQYFNSRPSARGDDVAAALSD